MKRLKAMTVRIGLLGILPFTLISCQSKTQRNKQIATIDSTLQVKVTSILKNKLSELYALSILTSQHLLNELGRNFKYEQ